MTGTYQVLNKHFSHTESSALFVTGKCRYGICVNFYRPMERAPPNIGGSRRDRHSSTFRRESWRKSMEKSSDSAFSRWAVSSIQHAWGGLPFLCHNQLFVLRGGFTYLMDDSKLGLPDWTEGRPGDLLWFLNITYFTLARKFVLSF